MAKKTREEVVQLSVELNLQEVTVHILGATPFLCNRMAEKAKQQLLFPSGRKTAAEKATSIKHNPIEEFRSAPYTSRDPASPTLIEMVAVSFKRSIESIALDVPGATKAQISRNLIVPDQKVPLYGIPQLHMAPVIQAGQSRTPDIRTRACLPEWACVVRIRYPYPLFREKVVTEFLALAGQLRGVGDWRPERGSGAYGLFEIVAPDDPRFLAVVANGGREAQVAAMAAPETFDQDTEDLYEWFEGEKIRRGIEPQSASSTNGELPV